MNVHGIEIDREKLAEFCRRRRIRKLSLFGSVLREDFTPESDVDVLVEFEEGSRISLFDLVSLQEQMSPLLGGHKVDLVPTEDLNRWIRKSVLAEAQPQYVAQE